ncbi:MAG: hypothetical protein FD181_1892 [Prolixibacteraceae bacterium]|nr:MAG: hypothetical protein FD181_1892 [Prolixibacteraceae bacterium]
MFKVKLLPEADSHIRMYLKAGNKIAYKKIQDFRKELK